MIRSTLPSKRRCFGDLSSEVADAYKLLASVLLSMGDMAGAAKAFQKVLIAMVLDKDKDIDVSQNYFLPNDKKVASFKGVTL